MRILPASQLCYLLPPSRHHSRCRAAHCDCLYFLALAVVVLLGLEVVLLLACPQWRSSENVFYFFIIIEFIIFKMSTCALCLSNSRSPEELFDMFIIEA
jgi:hypothetical protein